MITSGDTVTVLKIDSTKNGVLVEVNFSDAVEDKGTFGFEWPSFEEFEAFLNDSENEERTMLSLIRSALAPKYDINKKVVDDAALLGKAFSIDQNPVVSEVVSEKLTPVMEVI